MGAHGTGKTTLSQSLVERLSHSGIQARRLPEAPREICSQAGEPEFFRRGKNTPLRQNLILLVHLMQEFDSLLEGADIVISDRSLLDHWAYTLYLFQEQWMHEEVRSLYEAFIAEYCRSYDVIFFLPIEFAVVDDGTREGDKEFQAEIERLMLDLIQEHGLETVIVRGSVADRTRHCADLLLSKIENGKKGGHHAGL